MGLIVTVDSKLTCRAAISLTVQANEKHCLSFMSVRLSVLWLPGGEIKLIQKYVPYLGRAKGGAENAGVGVTNRRTDIQTERRTDISAIAIPAHAWLAMLPCW